MKGGVLTDAKSFDAVFRGNRYRVSSESLLLLAIENNLDESRLGLVIGKKHVRLATQRNRTKRLIRENFRHLIQDQPPCIDLVVLAKGGIKTRDQAALHQQVKTLMEKLSQKIERRVEHGE